MDEKAKRALLSPFAEAIFAKVRGLEVIGKYAEGSADRLEARMLESISDDIKKASNFIPHRQSVRAHDHEKAKNVNLAEKTWHEQHSFDKGRVTFLVEHKVPVSVLRTKCIAAKSADAVLKILSDELCVVWVLREEDDELTRLKFRSKRPDSDAAYAQARIELWAEE